MTGPPEERVDELPVLRIAPHHAGRDANDAAFLDDVDRPRLMKGIERVHRRAAEVVLDEHLHRRAKVRLLLEDDRVQVLRKRGLNGVFEAVRDTHELPHEPDDAVQLDVGRREFPW